MNCLGLMGEEASRWEMPTSWQALDQGAERKLGVSKPLPSCPEVLSVAMWASPEPQPFFFPTGDHVVFTNCSTEHSHPALSCKMAAEFDAFLASGRR